MTLSVIEQMSEQMINHEHNWEKANNEQNNESLTAELERYKERVKTFEQRLNIDLSCREKMIDSQMDDMIREKLALKEQVDSLEQNLSKQIKEKECLLETFNVFQNQSKEKENKYQENEIDLEKKIKELDNIVYKVGQSAQTVHMLTKPQAFYDTIHKQALVDVPSELPKVSLVNASLKKLKFHLTQFDSVVKKRTTPSALKEGSSKKAKIVESKIANHSEPNHTWGSNGTDIPSSSSLVMIGTVRFGNDHIARIMGYGDYQLGNVTISRVYYVEGLGHNLFYVGQFCNADLEVAFRKNTFFIRNLEGVDLTFGSRDTNLYTISLDDMLKTYPISLYPQRSRPKLVWNLIITSLLCT
ncbi:hypothetical protein Tco_0728665 [Tanacetum coccineum]|uniref:Integrase, catalytic region, zinc finger, CCHC-type, peptidase aspartic, catalytic n=1 Tax=Tanacetum coccineum TaxID=301880 RepID=A0ABQ4YLR9_9ASTR